MSDPGIVGFIVDIDRQYFQSLVEKAEELINRKIRSLIITKEEFEKMKDTLKIENSIIVWGKNE